MMCKVDIFEKKRALRAEIKEKIKALDDSYCKASDQEIFSKVAALKEYQDASTIFCFVGTGGEPDTRPIICHALGNGKTVGVPKCISDSEMVVYRISSLDDLEEGMYGILEPKEGLQLLEPSDIDFSLIPCVTCDLDGNRLGHGKGYYDRYLKKGDFVTCMLCRGKLVSEEVPVDSLDVKPDFVITDNI